MTPPWLFGIWRLERADAPLDFAPGVRMEFLRDGQLCYHVDVGGRDQTIDLRYRVEGELLHTENPSAPHTMTVKLTLRASGLLELDFGGPKAVLSREPSRN